MGIVRIRQLSKSYGSHKVLDQIQLDIDEGKLVGFLGPNGAGKTTTIRILLGLLTADTGEVSVFDQPIRTHGRQIRTDVGYLPGDVHLYSNLTGRQTLDFLAKARSRDCQSEIDRLGKRLELPLDRRVRNYSTGMRQKLGLIQALMHQPRLLVLDEPTSALDPLIRQSVFEELRHVIQQGRTVLFSSHSLNEVEELCDEVIVLRSGRVVEQQKIETLKSRALKKIEIEFEGQPPNHLSEEFHLIKSESNRLVGTWQGPIPLLLQKLQEFQIRDLVIEKPDLNDLFITYYRNTDADPSQTS